MSDVKFSVTAKVFENIILLRLFLDIAFHVGARKIFPKLILHRIIEDTHNKSLGLLLTAINEVRKHIDYMLCDY